ncbi:Gfo/Idh/MocA family oxidoreductase [Natrialba sp. PRR66]|uniref:Gfo/Idh/MocA family protein n=1 Tax=Natrialba sp. PRR66 TaxID=3098146 RepID=UPI002B1E5EF4|nr:Gfo/Idh/MocA family oxidoreductase [Natrialba sp. PRR66]
MSDYDIAFIGTGPEPDNPVWGESAAMAYHHASAYDGDERCSLVACADIVEENALAFAERNEIDPANVYTDYERMLREVEPDIVSVCTPVPTHADIVTDCANADGLRAIHCEKPMADTMADSRRMVAVCDERDIQLTFNHQRRVATPSRRAAELVAAGDLGEVTRVELATKNLFDAGTHLVDLCNSILDDRSAAWVMGQIDYRKENVRYGVHNENHAFVRWQYEDGTDAVIATGDENPFIDCDVRVVGTEGVLELNPDGNAQIRVRTADAAAWDEIDTGEPLADIPAAVGDIIRGLETDAEPQLGARRAFATMEIILGCYESVRRRERVEFPLSIDDNPLVSMVESGELSPRPAHEEVAPDADS